MGNSIVVRSILTVALVAIAACSSPRQNMLGTGGRGGNTTASGGNSGHGGGDGGGKPGTGSGGTATGGIPGGGGQPDTGDAGMDVMGTGGTGASGTGGIGAGGKGGAGADTGGQGTGGRGTGGVGTGGITGSGGAGGACALATGCCTNSNCPGDCMMCNTATHTCVAAKGIDDPNGRCAGTCDASGACKTKQGQACTTGSQCATTYCADGVCCNSACTGSCEFCNGTTPGTCGFATGAPKTGHAACGPAGTCAGTCDGTKATCKMPGSETTCRSMSCSAGTMTNPAVCDGNGNCPSSSTTPCGAYACNGTMSCFTKCQSLSDCAASSICTNGQCMKCPAGQNVCSNGCYDTNNDANHCGTSCRTCDAGSSTPSCANGACTCRVKKQSNLVTNGGFDGAGSLSAWNTDGTYNSANDYENCTGSGSLKLGTLFSQCVNGLVANQMYRFGLVYKSILANTPEDGVYCTLYSFSAAGCGGDNVGSVATQTSSAGTWVAATVDIQAGGPSMNISCSAGGLGIGSGPGYVDQIYLGPSNNPGF